MSYAKSFWSNYWRIKPSAAARFYSVKSQTPELSKMFLAKPGNPEQVAPFLKTNFKSNTRSPEYVYEKMPEEILIQAVDISGTDLLGTIRARPAGSFEYMPITLIDCFCVRPDMRRKGLGTFLLSSIKQACANNHIYNAIFLKEGTPILAPGILPVYSSYYVYRNISGLDKSVQVSYMSNSQAYKLISTYTMLRPDTFLILNKETENQKWLMYRHSGIWVLALVQNSFQTISGQKIAWITGWIESPLVDENARSLASESITSSITRLGYDWVWLDYKWIGKSSKFMIDGPFNWYTYQWATSLEPSTSYVIMA